MSNQPKPTEKSSEVVRLEPAEHAAMAPTPPAWTAPPDEIDLVDVGVLLWHRRRIMLAVFLVLLALTIIGTVLKSPSYQYTSTIELGSVTTQSGTLLAPLSADAAVSALQNTYIPSAIMQYEAAQHADLRNLKLTASAGSAGTANNFVTLSCRVKQALAAACIAVEKTAATNFVNTNSRSIDTLRANLQAQLAASKLTLLGYQDPNVFGVQKLAAEQAITDAQNTLTGLQTTAEVLKVSQTKTEASVTLYQKQATELEQHIADMRKASVEAARATASPTQAMSNLVLGTELQNNVNLLNQIQQNLTVTLPEQLATVNKNLADNVRSQTLQRQVIQQNQLALKKLLFDHNQQIQNQQVIVENLQAQVSNVVDNRVLGEPLRSINPIGLSRMAVLAVGIVLSIILAIFAAFVAAYVEQIRARLAYGTSIKP